MVHMNYIHILEQLFCFPGVSQGQEKARVGQRQARAADDARFVVHVVWLAEGENVNVMSGLFEVTLVQVDVIGDTANVGFVSIRHHANPHCAAFSGSPETTKEALF